MTDPPTRDPTAPSDEEASEPATPALGELRFVGPATEAVLADAAIDAKAILDRAVTFVELVKAGVDPGVAARIRREYSLPWSDAPTSGARLQRRAGHVRHLRADERSWINESLATERPSNGPTKAAASDGSGSATDAEAAWRARSGATSSPAPAERDGGDVEGTDPKHTRRREVPTDMELPTTDMELPINPNTHTVPELREALERIDEPSALAAVLRAERGGERRKTALEAIRDRLQAVGADPVQVATEAPPTKPQAQTIAGPAVREQREVEPATGPLTDGVPFLPDDIGAWLNERLQVARAEGRRRSAAARQATREYETHLRSVEAEDWRLLSLAVLLGFVVFSVLYVLLVALQPVIGPPVSALPLLAFTAVIGIVSLPLRWWETIGADGSTALTGGLGLATAVLIAAGAFGALAPGIPSVTLLAYAGVAAALLLTTYASREAQHW